MKVISKIKLLNFLASLMLSVFCIACDSHVPVDINDDPADYEGTEELLSKPLNQVVEEAGIDAKPGKKLPAIEDTYVQDGNNSKNDCVDTTYGDEETLECKKVNSTDGKLGRQIYIKFDLSEIIDKNIYSASINLYCKSTQTSQPTKISLFETNTNWFENSLTFRNKPENGAKIVDADDVGSGLNSIDITSFIKTKLNNNAQQISICVENTSDPACHTKFASKESEDNGPQLEIGYSPLKFSTKLESPTGQPEAWQYAAKMVNDWIKSKHKIEERGVATDSAIPEINPDEYTIDVDAAKADKTDGKNTVYTTYKTRTIDTLINYTTLLNEPADYDSYGGLMGDDRYNATGFFYITRKDNGRYVCVDPLGYPFYRVAMNAFSYGDTYINRNLIRQYGSNKKWAEYETNYLKNQIYYNSAGAWSSTDLLLNTPTPVTNSPIINFLSEYGKTNGTNNTTGGSTTFVNHAMPVFDPSFENFATTRAETVVTPYKDNKYIYGWMLDNELEADAKMVNNFMSLPSNNALFSYSYATVWTFLYHKLQKLDISVKDITDEIRKEFRAMVYDRYFSITTEAVKKVDTNHMLMGSRYLRTIFNDEWCMRVAGYYNDIVTFNMYNIWTPSDGSNDDSFVNIHNWTQRPFVVTEWYAKGMDACTEESQLTNKSGAGWTVRTQEDRGKFYHNYALRLMECKYCIGYDYFKLWDNNPFVSGADTSNTNSNKGIYNINHEPYTDLINAMKKLNRNKYNLINFFDNR